MKNFNVFDEGVTLVSWSNASLFIDDDKRLTGGSERQMRYIADALIYEGIPVQILTSNVASKVRCSNSGFSLENVWSNREFKLIRIASVIRAICMSNRFIYLRGLSKANMLVSFLGRIFGKKITVAMTSDLQCVNSQNLWTNIIRKLQLYFAHSILTQTYQQRQMLIEHFSCDSKVVFNVINPLRIGVTDQSLDFEDRDIDVIWIGNFDPRKSMDIYLSMSESLIDLNFGVIGDIHPDHIKYGEIITEKIHESGNIINFGYVAPDQIGKYLSRSKILVSTSQPSEGGVSKEGFPNVFLEAWSLGIPVVSLHSNPSGLLDSNEIGVLCSDKDDAMQIIEELHRDNDRWHQMALKSQEFSLKRDVTNSDTRKKIIDEIFL